VVIDHFGMNMPNIGVDCVLKDDFAGTYQSTVHMIQHGYKKIAGFTAVIPGQTSMAYEILQRKKGFETALHDYGISLPDLPALNVWDLYHNHDAIKRYLDAGVDAFVMPSDAAANLLLLLLNRLNIKVPEQVAIIGYDDDRLCRFSNPPLSSVQVPKTTMAKKAVEMLSERINSGQKGNYRSIILKPMVVPRESCGCKSHEEELELLGLSSVRLSHSSNSGSSSIG